MHIHDGEGSGYTVGVTEHHRMKVISIATTPERHVNHFNGLAFNLVVQTTPQYDNPSTDSGGICFLYMKNISEKDLLIEGLSMRLGGDGDMDSIDLVANDGETPVGGNEISPVNLNLGSGNTAEGIFLQGENISGMDRGITMDRIYVESGNVTVPYNFEQDIVVPKNNVVTFWAEYGGSQINLVVNFHYADVEDE